MQLSLLLSFLPPLIAAGAVPVSTSTRDTPIVARATETTNPYDPEITISINIPTITIPTVSILPISIPSLTLNLPSNTCTPTVAPDKNGWVPATECNALYSYYPSFGAAITFSILFGIVMVAHFIQATLYKVTFVWVILMGAIWECVGFVSRTFSTRNQQQTTLATMTQLLILLSPLWANAFAYMVLARLIWFFVPERRIGIFKPSLLVIIFVALDIGAFIIQLVGGSMAGLGQPPDQIQKGLHIYMAGIGIQEFFILLFLVIAVQFHREMLCLERLGGLVGVKAKWRRLLYGLYASLLFITVRIIFRLVEFSSGKDASNPILHNEWYMYVFDATPMLLAIAVWNMVHPGTVLLGPDAKMPPNALWGVFSACFKKRQFKKKQNVTDEDPMRDEALLLREQARPVSSHR